MPSEVETRYEARWTYIFWLCVALYLLMIFATDSFGVVSVRDWVFGQTGAAWVQAIGSVGAILAAVSVVKRQHELQVQLSNNVERGRQILMCTRALLACYGYLSALRMYSYALSRLPEGPARPFLVSSLGTSVVLLPMDLDSLAFLVNVSAPEVLSNFAQLNASERQWHVLKEDLAEFMSKEIDPRLSATQLRLGRELKPEELAVQIGPGPHTVLLRRADDIERLTTSELARLPSAIDRAATRIAMLYPEAHLPTPPNI